MNYFPNPYLTYFAQNPMPSEIYAPSLEAQQLERANRKVQLLENENKLLRSKIDDLEERLKRAETQEKSKEEPKTKKSDDQVEVMEHKCLYPNCDRNYKSSLALNLHIKTKHNGGSIREREAYAKLILECEKENKPRPEININFPPHFLENYRRKVEIAESLMKKCQ